jgi:hypothetical protein
VVEKAKTLTAKDKTSEFKSQQERDEFSATLENEEHSGHTRAIFSIASWKEGFADKSHMYKKRKTHEIEHNTEEIFAQQFFNFMRKKSTICCAVAYSRNQFGSRCHYSNPLLRAILTPLLIRTSIMWMTSMIPHFAH